VTKTQEESRNTDNRNPYRESEHATKTKQRD
jgi:hypothetical protein